MKLPQRQTIGSFSVLQEAVVYFGLFTTVVQAAGNSNLMINFLRNQYTIKILDAFIEVNLYRIILLKATHK